MWSAVTGTWQPIFGGYEDRGVSIEWHDFQLDEDLDWARSFHEGSLELCLNFSGEAHLHDGMAERLLPPGHVALYTVRGGGPRACRVAGGWHRFITVEMSPAFLRAQCHGGPETLRGVLAGFAAGDGCPPFLQMEAMSTGVLALRGALLDPPVPAAAREAWYAAKTLELLAHTVFREDEPGELFCHRQQRLNRDRVERVRYLLERDLENPPTLEMLAEDAGCSTFHLSRTFTEGAGMSIPKFVRTRRIERAAMLLRTGKGNVTTVAMAVGYSSLSAFNKAFVEQMGCCPGLYPAVKIAGR